LAKSPKESFEGEEKERIDARAVIKLAFAGMTTFAVTFAVRRLFFRDVMPIS
jgi:hypothetical protein